MAEELYCSGECGIENVKNALFVVGLPVLISMIADYFILMYREGVGFNIRDFLIRIGEWARINKKTQ